MAILTRFDKIINLCQANESFVYLGENTETRDSSMCSASEELKKLNSSEELEAYLKLIMKKDRACFAHSVRDPRHSAKFPIGNVKTSILSFLFLVIANHHMTVRMKHLFSKLWYLCSGIYFGTNQCFHKKRNFFISDLMICDFQNLFTNHQPFVVRFHFDHTKILTLLKRNTHIKVYCHSIKFQKARFDPNDCKADGKLEDTSTANTSTPLHVNGDAEGKQGETTPTEETEPSISTPCPGDGEAEGEQEEPHLQRK